LAGLRTSYTAADAPRPVSLGSVASIPPYTEALQNAGMEH
jgi:hypothetical protein